MSLWDEICALFAGPSKRQLRAENDRLKAALVRCTDRLEHTLIVGAWKDEEDALEFVDEIKGIIRSVGAIT